MHLSRVAALVAAVSLGASSARAQAPSWLAGGGNPQAATVTTGLCGTTTFNGATVGVPCAPGVAPSDPNNTSFAGSAALTPSGTSGHPGQIGGQPASATNTGRSFGWNCASAGLGAVTLVDGSIRNVWMYTNNGADVRGDAFAIIDEEPPSGVSCTFQVYR
ncbi:hypothetical protein NFI95_15485 [Acetobacteraceae bacterium KSS8]|uniref:Uncharacterized protein n=1 Tax=Endosaccharibacter trunci TaxID=2812733 RepID=A0ABT1WAD7_9PROT|nr:hypothetical protein [Acetobacteraceae bacterium KSS8]